MIYSKQTKKLRRSLCTPLEAVAYTNEVLVVSAMIGAMLVLLLATFAGNIDVMSSTIGKINDAKQSILKEKIDIISSEKIGNSVIITFTNYGDTDSSLLAFFVDGGDEITCTSNNVKPSEMTIDANSLLEVKCPVSNTSKIVIATSTHNILVVEF